MIDHGRKFFSSFFLPECLGINIVQQYIRSLPLAKLSFDASEYAIPFLSSVFTDLSAH